MSPVCLPLKFVLVGPGPSQSTPPGCTVLEVHIRWVLKPPILRLHLQLHLPDLSKVNFCCCDDDSYRAVLFEPLPSCIHILFLKIVWTWLQESATHTLCAGIALLRPVFIICPKGRSGMLHDKTALFCYGKND